MFYDGLLLLAVLFFAAFVFVLVVGSTRESAALRAAFQVYLAAVGFLFFGWFWTHGGQTLGMRAWRLRLVRRAAPGPITWRIAMVRYLAAIASWLCLGAGFLWVLIDRERLAWHDRLSATRLIIVPCDEGVVGPNASDDSAQQVERGDEKQRHR